MHDESRGDAGQDLAGDGLGPVEALLTGGDPRSLRNARWGHARVLHVPEIRLYTNGAMTENLAYYPRHRVHRDPPGPPGRLPQGLLPQTGGHLTARIAAMAGCLSWIVRLWRGLAARSRAWYRLHRLAGCPPVSSSRAVR